MSKVAVFSGTIEGRILARWVKDKGYHARCIFFVATDYGEDMLKDIDGIDARAGRLSSSEMIGLFREEEVKLVIDATHPYATVVTENIVEACSSGEEEISYLRLLRTRDEYNYENLIMVNSIEEAVEMIEKESRKVLLTTGSKELVKFAGIADKEKRLVVRVLPMIDSLELCATAGIERKNIIAMQGPFTKEMNMATMRQYGCDTLVTKDTGTFGGFAQKVSLGNEGYKVIIIRRPTVEKGISIEEAKKAMEDFYGA